MSNDKNKEFMSSRGVYSKKDQLEIIKTNLPKRFALKLFEPVFREKKQRMEVSRERGKSCPDWVPTGLQLSERKQKNDLPKTSPMRGLRIRQKVQNGPQ